MFYFIGGGNGILNANSVGWMNLLTIYSYTALQLVFFWNVLKCAFRIDDWKSVVMYVKSIISHLHIRLVFYDRWLVAIS